MCNLDPFYVLDAVLLVGPRVENLWGEIGILDLVNLESVHLKVSSFTMTIGELGISAFESQ
jgi:hypothetical protein